MADIHKIMQIQSNVLDSMLSISAIIKSNTRRNIDREINDLLRLSIVFEKIQPKYLEIGKD